MGTPVSTMEDAPTSTSTSKHSKRKAMSTKDVINCHYTDKLRKNIKLEDQAIVDAQLEEDWNKYDESSSEEESDKENKPPKNNIEFEKVKRDKLIIIIFY